MPKAPLPAQITIVLFAVLAIVYGASVIRLTEDSSGTRHAVPGQLVVVMMHSSWTSLQSSDTSVVAPISVSLTPITRGYFLALKPGKAWLQGYDDPCPVTMVERCMAPVRGWGVGIEVWPG
ncbi:MAG: hypothetical protein E6I81_12540 [Chloroflexi bacterium]|nr:MAG: hypothetical protein AUI15_07605 [Actinobacteria bacterium 13_2_20CM_2_66_6]TMD39227.1 MAG: hypothetical protein E6I89_05590 [Chloroflexota bacterium]TMD70906.1 MAG: hypothetical protein E6I81_12540 [Chloroflexota bacterium]